MRLINTITTLIIIILSFNIKEVKPTTSVNQIPRNNYNEIIGNIIIEKININKPLYNINHNKNNIEENITILKESILPPNNNSIIFLAAHSGTSNISYFNEINKLNINDEIKINLYNKEYIYLVKDISKQKKSGYININKETIDQLILTTCDPKNNKYQIIINCTKKEFN